jgi:hypothetical protein
MTLVCPGVYVDDLEVKSPPPIMDTLEGIEAALKEVATYHLFEPNTEENRRIIQASFTDRLREMYANGFKICDPNADPIENVEDCEVVVTVDDNYYATVSFVPTEEYWNRKLETYARNFERLVTTLQADSAMEFFDPCI